jgi:hypothetical protein
VANFLQKLMFWRKQVEPEAATPLPDSGPNDPPTGEVLETPDEKPYREDRPSSSASEPEQDFRRKLFEE